MKTLAVLLLAAAFTGCTTTTTTRTLAENDARQRELSVKRVHTQEELKQTGRPEIGDALQTVDPSVYISTRSGH